MFLFLPKNKRNKLNVSPLYFVNSKIGNILQLGGVKIT